MRSVIYALLIGTIAVDVVAAQTSGTVAFDAASIKQNMSGSTEMAGGFQPGGRFRGINMTARMLIAAAYGGATPISPEQIVDGPKWIDADRFDVEATPATPASPEQRALMLRALLATRFGLAVHAEQREAPAYVLVVARSDRALGPRLQRAAIECVNASHAPLPLDPNKKYCGALTSDKAGHFFGVDATMTQLASVMSRRLGRPVVDQTHLDGTYDLEIDYVPGIAAGTDPADGVSIFTAFQEQLGLKLQPSTRPVDVFVIDRVEHPTAD